MKKNLMDIMDDRNNKRKNGIIFKNEPGRPIIPSSNRQDKLRDLNEKRLLGISGPGYTRAKLKLMMESGELILNEEQIKKWVKIN